MSEVGRHDRVASVGAVVSAALASMCCILPFGLAALGLGLSGAVVAAFFEPLRPYFLVLAALLLGLGFYLSSRTPSETEACSTGTSSVSRASRPTLLAAALATAALAMFPSIVGSASGDGDTLALETRTTVIVLQLEGMTCEGCATGIRNELLDVPGVIDAAVSYERKVAEIRVREERAPEVSLLVEAVERAGFSALSDLEPRPSAHIEMR